jgi:hypothetical protein
MRGSLDQVGGADQLVDKLIGNAYDVVYQVRLKLPELMRINDNLRGNKTVYAVAGPVGSTVMVPLPEGISHTRIVASSVLLADTRGNIYGTDTGYFTTKILDGQLRVMVTDQTVAELSIRWFITFEE